MNLLRRALGAPSVYNRIRPLAVGGIDLSPFYRRLGADGASVILDVGCGTGDALNYLDGYARYVGFDTDEIAIRSARKRFGSRADVAFESRPLVADDVRQIDPPQAIMGGLLHHLSDDQALALFRKVRLSTRLHRLITLDVVYLDGTPLNNLFARLDRGRFCRTREGYESLAERSGLNLRESLLIRSHPRTGLVWYLIMVLKP